MNKSAVMRVLWQDGFLRVRLPFANAQLTVDFRALIAAYALLPVLSIVVLLLKYRHARETQSPQQQVKTPPNPQRIFRRS